MYRIARIGIVVGAVSIFTALSMVSALADIGAGTGQTPLSAALGFTVHSDGTGELNYVADPLGANAGFIGHCDGFTKVAFGTTKAGYPIVRVQGACTDQGGTTVYLKASFTDKGEPGTNDTLCIIWSYYFPVNEKHAYIHDMGVIQNGNIQITSTPEGTLDAEMLSTV